MLFEEAKKIVSAEMKKIWAESYDWGDDFAIWICEDGEHQWVLDSDMYPADGLTLCYCDADVPLDVAYLEDIDDEAAAKRAIGEIVDENTGSSW